MTSNFGTLHQIHTDARFSVFRARGVDGADVVIKQDRSDRSELRGAERLRHEYEVLRTLGSPSTPKALELTTVDGRPSLVLEDVGSHNLAERMGGRPLATEAFLELAPKMVGVVRDVHERNVIHRDVCPENFVVDDRSGSVTLVDFDLATAVPAFAGLPGTPGTLQGTLAYMAPEQTGRMQRLVDRRADLYSLGATFYELLTGQPPFQSSDPGELALAHAARTPYPPALINNDVPTMVSDIVVKLLAKMPEQRYQSAEALALDLEEARQQWQRCGQVADFELGRRDLPYGLLLGSDNLYGRDRETGLLAQAFERAAAGASEVLFVTGPAGIGKSALLRALHEATLGRARWISGKGDQLRGNAPYAPLAEAFRELVPILLSEPEDVLSRIRERIRQATTPNGYLLTQAIPDLEPLLADQAPVASAGAVADENRFQLVVTSFLRALLAEGPPLVLALDDLQWFDTASLKVLHGVAVDPDVRSLLILCAYRSDEIGSAGPVKGTLDSIRRARAPVTTLELGPLDSDAVLALLCDGLRADPERAASLADVLRPKTGSNPFFIRQFLGYLYRKQMLVFDAERARWDWDAAAIETAEITPNVVDLLSRVIGTLPDEAQEALRAAACIGNRFELGLLAGVLEMPAASVANALWAPIRDGLIIAAFDGPRFRWAADTPIELGTAVAPAFRFVHDRVQQAAYGLLSDEARKRLHLRIGRWLEQNAPEDAFDATVGPIADQLNRAEDQLSDMERLRLARLNEQAGQKARARAAFGSALGYFQAGIQNLPSEAWRGECHPLWFTLVHDAAECAAVSGDHDLSERIVDEALLRTRELREIADLHAISVQTHLLRGVHASAIQRGRHGLAALGIDLPETPSAALIEHEHQRARAVLGAREEWQLLDSSAMVDPLDRARLRLLTELISSWYVDPGLFQIVACRAASLTAEKGHAPGSAVALAYYAMQLVMTGEYERAYHYGRIAVKLAERLSSPVEECRALHSLGSLVAPWRVPLAECVSMLQRAHRLGAETGEVASAASALANIVYARMFTGARLDQVLADAEASLGFYRKFQHVAGLPFVQPFAQMARCLKGLTRTATTFDDPHFEEARFRSGRVGKSGLPLAVFLVLKMQVLYLHGELESAWEYAEEARRRLEDLRTLFFQVDFHFYAALTAAKLSERSREATGEAMALQVRKHLGPLEAWANGAPANFQHKRDLVAAELARLEERPADALALYLAAIEQAGRQGFTQDEALGHELCARFHQMRDAPRAAELHLRAALEGYFLWGASGKAQQLCRESSSLRLNGGSRQVLTPAPPPDLDYHSLIKSSETLAQELVFEQLLAKLVHTCAEVAGAERTVLILDEGQLMQCATADATGEVRLEAQPLASSRSLPISVVAHVLFTREPLVLADAARAGPYTRDPYVAEHGVRSILAVPILRGEKVLGALYLENNLASDAFTPGRVEMFRLLSTQMAIAIENSRLFAEHERSEAAVRMLSDTSVQLSETLDYEERLVRISRVFVPGLADWCCIHMLDEGALRPVAWAHVDPAHVSTLEEWLQRYPIDTSSMQLQGRAWRSGKPLLLSDISQEMIVAGTRNEAHARLLRTLGTASAMIVPMLIRGRGIGVVTLVSSKPGRFHAPDLALSEELVRRVSVALENGRLYRDLGGVCRKLEQAVSRWEATVNATAEGIVVVDLDGRIVSVNQRFLSLWRLPARDPQGLPKLELLSPVFDQLEDPEAFLRRREEIYAHADEESSDVIRFKDGRIFERHSTPQRMGEEITGRVWSIRDVTERERLLNRALFLSDAARLLASLDVEQALDGVAHLAVPYLGNGCTIDLFGKDGPRRVVSLACDTRRPFSPEVHPNVLGGNSAMYWVESISYLGVPLLMKGNLIGAVTLSAATGRDYTADDREIAEELARRAALAIDNARLYREAQEALRARDEFLEIAAHEIRGPIHAIHLAVQMIRQAKVSPAALPGVFELVERQDRRLAQFVDELVELGRIRAGRLHLEFEHVSLGEVVREVEARFALELARSGSTLTVTAPGPIVGQWDKSRLDQIVSNLISNAIKFGLGKPIGVTIDARDGRAVLIVEDHGMGMEADFQKRVFLPFERGVSVRHYGGLGLGLHIVKTIVDALGGSISVTSEPGVGSTFTVELPRENVGAAQ